MMAVELAIIRAPPTPWNTRMMIMYRAPAGPCSQVTDSRIENTVKMTKPRLYMRTRPKMSGREISTIEASMVAISTPRVVFDRVDHLPLYGSAVQFPGEAGAGARTCPLPDNVTEPPPPSPPDWRASDRARRRRPGFP